LFHGAGTNVSTDVQLMANLLQVSSAFGRAMETVDRIKITKVIYPVLRARRDANVPQTMLSNALACAAEGYPFPTNLDLDDNVDGLTPLSQAALVEQALAQDWTVDRLQQALDSYAVRHRTHEI
jgi:ectoine hydroxylase-related dioxygenase (phytanoyl-CoA dioxygenase family)